MLQGYVSHLRKTLEPGRARGEHELLVSKAPGYVLRIDADHVDAARFERLVGDGRGSLSNGDATAAAERFRSALALWRGPALDDLAYEAFARADIERLEELRLQTLEDRIDAELALGHHGALVPELRELVDENPLRERLRAQLMAALYRCGRQAHALEAYRDSRRVLHDELGIEPGPALRELELAILRQDPALGAPMPPPQPAKRPRRRWLAPACIAAAVGAALAAGLVYGRSGAAKMVVVEPHSVAVIDPGTNSLAKDIPVGGYPGPLAADDEFIYVCNIGDATFSRIVPGRMKVYDTGSLSRATDLAAVDRHLWAADGGTPGHTPEPPGTVLNYDLLSAESRLIRVGPSVDGDEEQTTLAADGRGHEVWAGNKDAQTVTEVEPPTRTTVHRIVPGGLAAVAGSSASSDTVWASDQRRDAVVRIDGDTGRVVSRIPVPGRPARIAADARAVWVIARDQAGSGGWQPTRGTAPAVWRIDPMTNERVAKISLPLTPIRIALGEGSVWVTAMRVMSHSGATVDATVFRIDPASNRIVARIPLHTGAVDGILVSHGRVWVAVPAPQ